MRIFYKDKISKKMSKDLQELVLCNCGNAEHQLIFRAFDGDDDPWVYVTIHLRKFPFWKRLVNGVKYIFGHRSKYGDFDEIILTPDHCKQLQHVVRYMVVNHSLKKGGE